MAIRTVSVELRLDATAYLARGNRVAQLNREIDRSFDRIARSSARAAAGTQNMSNELRQMSSRARLAERRVRELREEVDRLIAAQAALNAGGPIPNIGSGLGGRMGGGILQTLIRMFTNLPAPVQLAIGAGLAAAVWTAAPLIGGAISGVFLTALAGGGLAAGIVSAAKDPEVRQAFGLFGKQVAADFAHYGDAFEVPLIRAANHFRDRWASVSPEIRDMLAGLSVAVEPLARGMTGFVERSLPGLKRGLDGALPVLIVLANELPSLGNTIGDFFALLAGASEGGSQAFKAFIDIMEFGVISLGSILGFYSKVFEYVVEASTGLVHMLASLPAPLKLLIDPMGVWLDDLDASMQKWKAGTESAGEGLDGLTYKADSTAGALERLTARVRNVNDVFLQSQDAAIGYERALDGISASAKENGRSLDITNEKGRQNREALLAVVAAADAVREANIKAGMTTAEANAKYNAQVEALRRAAYAAGLNKQQVDALLASLQKLPVGDRTMTYTVRTKYVTEGTRPAYTPGTHYYQRHGGVVYARDGLMNLSGAAGIFTGGRPIYGFAEPGTGAEAFIAANADHGRSLAIANQAAGWHGGMVVPKGGAGSSTVINVSVNAGLGTNGYEVGDQIVSVLQREVQRRGGNVQLVLAGRDRG